MCNEFPVYFGEDKENNGTLCRQNVEFIFDEMGGMCNHNQQ